MFCELCGEALFRIGTGLFFFHEHGREWESKENCMRVGYQSTEAAGLNRK